MTAIAAADVATENAKKYLRERENGDQVAWRGS